MKKKIFAAAALMLIIVMALGVLAGCDEIFKLNEERDMSQTVASVSYNSQHKDIKKFELRDSFNAYAYIYVSYYGMSYEQAADYILGTLAQTELMVMFAKEQLAKDQGIDRHPSSIALEELLNNAEKDRAIDKANESLLSALESIVEDSINTDKRNNADIKDPETDKDEDEEVEITDPVYIFFDSMGGSEVERQRIQNGKKVKEPADPTRSGYTFYGWYEDKDNMEGAPFDFDTAVNAEGNYKSKRLYAKWVKYTDPRTERPEQEEEDNFDPEKDIAESEISVKFFEEKYLEEIDFSDKDFAKDATKPLQDYIDDGIAKLTDNLKKGFKGNTLEEAYGYYLENQQKTLVLEKLERVIGDKATMGDNDIQNEFDRLVEQNKETFRDGTSYQSALTSALATTYYHPLEANSDGVPNSYGFVVNILLKLDDEQVNELVDLAKEGYSKEYILQERDKMLGEMTVKISNPFYKSSAKEYNDAEGNPLEGFDDIEIRDPMTDPRNPYNNPDRDENKALLTKYCKDNGIDEINYNQMISFRWNSDKDSYEIVYNIVAYETMPYIFGETAGTIREVNAVGENSITKQIHESFKQITDEIGGEHGLNHITSVYWLREMANAWLYLVGDDSGALNSESNNDGLGYLVTPEGEESSYLEPFTEHARALIANGTGSYSVDGTYGKDKSYVYADSFIESGNTSNAYAGIFVLLASYVVWDENSYTYEKDGDGNYTEKEIADTVWESARKDQLLPMDYIITYGKTMDECKTVRDYLGDSIRANKESVRYNKEINAFMKDFENKVTYNKKAYKSLWKDLDKR